MIKSTCRISNKYWSDSRPVHTEAGFKLVPQPNWPMRIQCECNAHRSRPHCMLIAQSPPSSDHTYHRTRHGARNGVSWFTVAFAKLSASAKYTRNAQTAEG